MRPAPMLRLWSRSATSLTVARRRTRCIDAAQAIRTWALDSDSYTPAARPAALVDRRRLWLQPSQPCLGGGARRRAKGSSSPLDTSSATPVAVKRSRKAGVSASAGVASVAPECGATASAAPTASTCKRAAGEAAQAAARTETAAAHTPDGSRGSSVTVVTVDLLETLSEWEAVQSTCAGAGEHRATRVSSAVDPPGAPPPVSRGGRTVSAAAAEPVADRAAVMSAILRHPDLYPQLHTLFFLDKDGETGAAQADRRRVAELFDLVLEGGAVVVRSEPALRALLQLMRAYVQLSRQSTWMEKVSGRIGATLLEELSKAWAEAAGAIAKAPRPATGTRDEWKEEQGIALAKVQRSAARVLLELRRTQFAAQQLTRRPPRSRKTGKRTDKATPSGSPPADAAEAVDGVGETPPDAGVWPVTEVRAFLQTTAVSMADAVVSDLTRAGGARTLTGEITAYVFLLLAVEVEDAVGADSTDLSAVTRGAAWRAATAQVRAGLERDWNLAGTPGTSTLTGDACRRQVQDVLGGLLLCHEFHMVVPDEVRQAIHAEAIGAVQRACRAVGHQPDWFPLLCDETIAQSLEGLRGAPGSLHEQLCTDIFSAAAAFLTASSADTVDALVREKEAGRAEAESHRPPLHTPLAKVCYALMCAGFSPDAILSSSLCTAQAAVDVADITAAAALFSSTFAVQPLPVRVGTALVDNAVALVKRALLLEQRAVQSPTDLLLSDRGGPTSFTNRVAAGGVAAAATAVPPSPAMTRRLAREPNAAEKKRAKHRRRLQRQEAAGRCAALEQEGATAGPLGALSGDAGIVTKAEAENLTSQAYYVAVSALVESLCRGDGESAQRVLRALFPLLELDGSTAYLVESLELVMDRVRRRLAQAGVYERTQPNAQSASKRNEGEPPTAAAAAAMTTTTLAMEQVFVEVAHAYQGRVSDSILRQTMRLSAPSTRETGAGGAVSGVTSRGESGSSGLPAASPSARAARRLGKDGIDEALKLVFRFTVCVLTLGMKTSFDEQLASLHATLRAAAVASGLTAAASGGSLGPREESAAARDAAQVVRQLDHLISSLAESRLPVGRHPQSAHVRASSVAVNKVVAVHLTSTGAVTAALRQGPQPNSTDSTDSVSYKRQRSFVMSVVHLLFRLTVDHAVEAEPAKLRAYRTEILEPAVAYVLHRSAPVANSDAETRGSNSSVGKAGPARDEASPSSEPLTLATLTEAAAVMCVPRTIHHVSSEFYSGLTHCVVHVAASTRASSSSSSSSGHTSAHHHHLVGALSQRLLCAAATICLRASPELTDSFLRIADALEPLLTARQCVTVLETALQVQVPPSAPAITRMVQRLASALTASVVPALASSTETPPASRRLPASGGGSRRANLALGDAVTMLHVLSEFDVRTGGTSPAAVDIPYGPVLQRLCRPESLRGRGVGLRQLGQLVQTAAALPHRPEVMGRCSSDERACIEAIPRTLAVPILQSPQKGTEHDIPSVLTGYAQVREPGNALRERVMRAFLSRTMRACPVLAPTEVVVCVEAYCAAGIYHEYLFSVLLGRVADVTQRFSLDLALRLLRCGREAGHPQLRTACLTAAQPVFVGHVRHVLQSDPLQLVTVGSTSTTILACLRDCFPRDPISAAVLENIAAHHVKAGLSVTKAALHLAAARGSQDYGVVRALADHCTTTLLPTSRPDDMADVAFLLVSCGVRSSALMLAITDRSPALSTEASGYALARLSLALSQACVDVDTSLVEACVHRVITLVDDYVDAVDAAAAAQAGVGHGGTPKPIVPPFTSPQAVAALQFLRGCSRSHYAIVTPGVDALLTYLGVLWAQEADTPDDAATALSTTQPANPFRTESVTLPDVEVVLAAAVEQASDVGEHAALIEQCAAHTLALLAQRVDSEGEGKDGMGGLAEVYTDADLDRLGGWGGLSQPHAQQQRARQPVSAAAVATWRNDVGLLTRLANYLVRASTRTGRGLAPGTPSYAAAHALFDALYGKRGALLQRHLLLDTTQQTLKLAGKDVHVQLYGLVVEKKLL